MIKQLDQIPEGTKVRICILFDDGTPEYITGVKRGSSEWNQVRVYCPNGEIWEVNQTRYARIESESERSFLNNESEVIAYLDGYLGTLHRNLEAKCKEDKAAAERTQLDYDAGFCEGSAWAYERAANDLEYCLKRLERFIEERGTNATSK